MTGSKISVISVWLLGKFRIEVLKEDGTVEVVPAKVWGGGYARPLFKRLLCATGRRATRSTLIDQIWLEGRSDEEKESREQQAEEYLTESASRLRHIFGTKEIIQPLAGGYELAGTSLLQTDIDGCKQLMTQVERGGLSKAHAISLLETVRTHFERGSMLEGENGAWCLAFRARQEKTMHYCAILLAEAYERENRFWQAQEQYERLFELNPIDEDALRRLLAMLHRTGRIDDLRRSYEEGQKRFAQNMMSLSQTTEKLFEKLLQEPPPLDIYLAPPMLLSRPNESETLWWPDTSLAQPSPTGYNMSSQLSSLSHPELPEMLMIQRRKFLYDLLNAAGSSIIVSPYALFSQESRERLKLMMAHPSYVDEKAIDALASTIQNFWDLRQNIAPINLLGVIAEHLTTITQLSSEARPTGISKRLCALASENARLLGAIFDEIHEFDLAWKSFAFALKMAQEIQHNDLWVASAVHLAELIIEWGEPRGALPLLQEAHKKGIQDQRLPVWLSAVEAEIYARMGNRDKFLRAWEPSKNITLPQSLVDDLYRTRFTPSMVAGYEARSFLWLHQPEQALPLLKEQEWYPTFTRGRSLRLGNQGRVYGQLGDVKKACELLLESLGIIKQTKSLFALQRVYQGRAELDPWKESGDVKEVDARIVEVYKSLVKVKERV